MSGVILFLFEPSPDGKKEYIINELAEEFQMKDFEVFQINLAQANAFELLGQVDLYFSSITFDKKHIVFSIDGDGFGLTLKMDGRWMDNIQYNVFTYLTKHPKNFIQELSGINSWYIAILSNMIEGEAYITENYPQLDGTEYMTFPAFEGKFTDCLMQDRIWELFIDGTDIPEDWLRCFLGKLSEIGIRAMVICRNNPMLEYKESIYILKQDEIRYEHKLDLFGKSRLVLFLSEENANMDLLSAMANGAAVLTMRRKEWEAIFKEGTEIEYLSERCCDEIIKRVQDSLKDLCVLGTRAKAGREKARKIGSISCFVNNLLERSK